MKPLIGYTDIFIDPVTGAMQGGGNTDASKATYITQTVNPLLPNAQALISLENGLMRKGDNGVVNTSKTITIEELPELKGEWIKSVFGGDIFRGTKDGKVERSGALTKVEEDLIALNAKFMIANFIMGGSFVKKLWPGATFLDDIKPGILFNCAPLPHEKGVLRRAEPGVEYMQPDLKEGRIWMGIEDRGYDPITKQVKAPWLNIGIEIGENSLITLDSKGVMKKATLTKDYVWCGDETGNPIEKKIGDQSADAKYIIQVPDESLPNAQALNDLGSGMVKLNNIGQFQQAIVDEDYATKETLEKIKEEAKQSEEAAKASAEAAETSATEATGTAAEATGAAATATAAAGTAAGSASSAAGSVVTAGLSVIAAAASAASASGSSRSASGEANAAVEAANFANKEAKRSKDYAKDAEKARDYIKDKGVQLKGDIIGAGKLDEEIKTKFIENPVFRGTECITLPSGTVDKRPKAPFIGMLRCKINQLDNIGYLEYYNGQYWVQLSNEPPDDLSQLPELTMTKTDLKYQCPTANTQYIQDMDTSEITEVKKSE